MIIRVQKRKDPYARIDKVPINDKRLTWKARGVLLYLLSKPDDWRVIIADLINQSPQGESAVRAALHELKEAGYIQREVTRENGKITGSLYTVREKPIKTPVGENLNVESLNVEDQARLTNEEALTNKEATNKIAPSAQSQVSNPLDDQSDKTIDLLNLLAGTRYRHSKASRKFIRTRIREGATFEDCKLVIEHKVSQWRYDPEMSSYLRPSTLFRPSHFEEYLAAAIRWHEDGRPQTEAAKHARSVAYTNQIGRVREEYEARKARGEPVPEIKNGSSIQDIMQAMGGDVLGY